MQRIRLRRVGRKNEPHYQVVVTPRTNPVKGSFTAKLGWYNPTTKTLRIDEKATLDWLDKGAQPSNTMAKLLIAKGIKHNLVIYKQSAPKKPKKGAKQEKKLVQPENTDSGKETTNDNQVEEVTHEQEVENISK